MTKIDNATILERLRWRYAVKQFDAEQKLTEEDWQTLQLATLLTPSSFGLQPWRFVVVTNENVKQQLIEHSWGQTQPRDCSHLVILAARKTVDVAYVDKFLSKVAEDRSLSREDLDGYRSVILQFIDRMDDAEILSWTSRQVYIVLGQLLSAAAMLNVDTCPMEGIEHDGYDKLLKLKDTPYRSIVACALGYRHVDDHSASDIKVRFNAEDLFAFVD